MDINKQQWGTQGWSVMAARTHTADSCDWFMTEFMGMTGFLEDLAPGLLRSANGWMFLQDCRYWDIRTDARCLFSPDASVFAWNVMKMASLYVTPWRSEISLKKLMIDNIHALHTHAPTSIGFLDMLSGFWGSITRKVFLPFRRGSRLPPSPSSTWYAPFKCSSVSSVMWTRLLMIVEKDRRRGSHTLKTCPLSSQSSELCPLWAEFEIFSPRKTSRFHVIC